jgi:hypothetical protein
MPVCSPVAVG